MIPINKFEDLPIFESSQFQFVNVSPLNSELITLTNNLKFQERLLRTKQVDWSLEMNLSRELHNNPRYAMVISQLAIDKLGHERASNNFRYLNIFIKHVKIRPVDHVAIILWFIENGLIDIPKTIETNKIKI